MRQTSIQSRNGESGGRIQEWGGGKGGSNGNWDKLRWMTEAFTFDYVNGLIFSKIIHIIMHLWKAFLKS